jgi:hypothetical protein
MPHPESRRVGAYGGGMEIEYPGFGSIVVEGVRFEHDVVIEAGTVRRRVKRPSRPHRARFGHTPLSAAEDLPWGGGDLVVGTGHSGRLPVLDDVAAEARERGIRLTTVPTSEACALLAEVPRDQVFAVLHVTC